VNLTWQVNGQGFEVWTKAKENFRFVCGAAEAEQVRGWAGVHAFPVGERADYQSC
jgi:hypothetical protein